MKIFGINFFEKTQLEKNDLIIWNFVRNLSEIEKIKIFNKNLNEFKIVNQNKNFYNEKLGKEINDFFNKISYLKLNGNSKIEISEMFLHRGEEYKTDYYQIGELKIQKDMYEEEGLFFIKKYSDNILTEEDFEEEPLYNTTIYHILVGYMLLNKYRDKHEEVEILEKLKEELK